jgi:hypothetical protein
MPAERSISMNSDEARTVLDSYFTKNEEALELYKQNLNTLFQDDAERVTELLNLRKNNLFDVVIYYTTPELNVYYKVNQISECLAALVLLKQQLHEMNERGISIYSLTYQAVDDVFEDALYATAALISRKKINSDLMFALDLIKKTVVATRAICLQPDNQELRDSASQTIVNLSIESDKILCPYARKAVGRTIIVLAMASLLIIPIAILVTPVIMLAFGMPLITAMTAWNEGTERGMRFWNNETGSLFKPLVNSLNNFFHVPAAKAIAVPVADTETLDRSERTGLLAS